MHDGRAKLTPADLATRDALADRLFRERGGREALDIVSQLRVEDYATAQIQLGKVTKRLELMGAVSEGGNKRTSLVDTYNTFSARVERLASELPPPLPTRSMPTDHADLDTTDGIDQAIARAERALKMLQLLRNSKIDDDDPADPPAPPDAGNAGLTVQATKPTTAPAPEPRCTFGCGTVARCEEIKATRLDDWRALHYTDPDEVQRRSDEATKEMLRQIGKPSPWD